MLKKYLLLSIFILFSSMVFSQEQGKILPFMPTSSQQNKLKRKIEKEKSAIRNSGYFTPLQTYLAVREEDLSVCNSKSCREDAQDLLTVRYLGEGRCEEVDEKELCYALKNNNCSSLSGWKRDSCKGLLDGNIDLLINTSNSPGFIRETGGRMSEGDVLEILEVYAGFKYYSGVACERYLKDSRLPLSKRVSCSILFSSDPYRETENILEDLAIFELSREEVNSDICNSIKNREIKKACQDLTIKQLKDIW